MRRLVAAVLTSGTLLVPLAVTTSAGADVQSRSCEFTRGKTICVQRTVTTAWSGDQGHEHGFGDDGALAAQWCVQDWSETPLVEYEAFAHDYLVETTTRTRTVHKGRHGKLLRSRTAVLDRRIVDARTSGGGMGAAITCSYA